MLSEPGPQSDRLRREALRLITISDTPNLIELNEAYNRSLRTRSLSQPTPPAEVDAAPYLSSFFDALIAELYVDPFFKQQMSDAIKLRADMGIQRSLGEVVTTLRQINENLVDHYTPEQFARDVEVYTAHIERTLHYLKLVGVVPKDRGEKNTDPELNGIFVPLRIALQDRTFSLAEKQDSILALLGLYPYIVLLGGPGSGKSTVTRHLAWSHAVANQSDFSIPDLPLLSGNPLPLRIELRRLTEDRRQHPDYNFLSYTTEVLLGREGVKINSQMFQELLERRTMLLLFDGLDEVATLDERRRLIEEIEHFALCYPGNRIIVTSRPVGYELARFSNQWFAHAQVQEFDDTQIQQFLERWYTHVLKLSPIPYDDQQELETLLMTLKGNGRLHKLAENPLLLSVITALHRYERLPDRRVLVYDRCADLLLETWAKLKGTDVRWKDMKMVKEDQYACIAHLGFVLHERSQEKKDSDTEEYQEDQDTSTEDIASDVSARFMLREIEAFLRSQKLITGVAEQRAEAKRFFELMQVEAGLIVERGTGEENEALYGFVHRTFQEYFAATDVHERYQQKENPKIISQFLKEHLHDPHWREVILLLLGKLKRVPVTTQLRQILEGKIKSRLSQYTEIVQQDLFFVCNCLAEEIAVENVLAELVVSRLSKVVKTSPFPSQRKEALYYLGELMQTRQYASLGRKELLVLAAKDNILDISTRIYVVQILYLKSRKGVQEQQHAIQILSDLVQCINFSVEQVIQTTEDLSMSPGSDQQCLALQMFLQLAHRPDLSTQQAFQIAEILYLFSSEGSEERDFATRKLFQLMQSPDLPIRQAIEITGGLIFAAPEGHNDRLFATQMLLQLIRRPDLSTEQTIQLARNLYLSSFENSEEERLAIQMLLQIVQNPDLPFEQVILATQALYESSPKNSAEQHDATQTLLQLAHHSDLSIEQAIRVAQALYESSPENSDEECHATQMLLQLARRSDLSIEQTIQVAQALYESSPENSDERHGATRILLQLARRSDLSIDQTIQVAQALYESRSGKSERQLSIQLLLRLTQNKSLINEQRKQAIKEIISKVQVSYTEKAEAVQVLFDILEGKAACQYLEKYWEQTALSTNSEISEITSIMKLAQNDKLPSRICDDAYGALRQVVPQFDKITL